MSNIAIFVAHEGCPHLCSFCDQRIITGQQRRVSGAQVAHMLETARRHPHHAAHQIAFFGGSFTAIEPAYMKELLDATLPFREDFAGIRISTRPDAVESETLAFLKQYDVRAIELGAQSMDDEVLRLNRRGHTAVQVVQAAERIKAAGFELGLQMMTGLYGDTDEKALETARKIIALRPATVRIYPTVVLAGTELDRLYRAGVFQPQTLEEAVALCAKLIPLFERAGIRIIRLGLHASEQVEARRTAGAYHPAFKELCLSRLYLERATALLRGMPHGAYTLEINDKCLSQMIGQNKENIEALRRAGYTVKISASPALKHDEIKIKETQACI